MASIIRLQSRNQFQVDNSNAKCKRSACAIKACRWAHPMDAHGHSSRTYPTNTRVPTECSRTAAESVMGGCDLSPVQLPLSSNQYLIYRDEQSTYVKTTKYIHNAELYTTWHKPFAICIASEIIRTCSLQHPRYIYFDRMHTALSAQAKTSPCPPNSF